MAIINSVKRAGIAKAGYCTIRMSPAKGEMERALLETIRKCPEHRAHQSLLCTGHHNPAPPGLPGHQVYTRYRMLWCLRTQPEYPEDRKDPIPASLCWQQAETDRCTGRPPIPPLPPEMGWPWFTAPRAALKIWSSSSFTQRLLYEPGVWGHSFLITEAVGEMGNTLQCFRERHSWSVTTAAKTWPRGILLPGRSIMK